MSEQLKIVWITGASTGIGAATALKMAREGWHVIASARSADKLAALAAQNSDNRITAMPCDVTDKASVHDVVGAILKSYGKIDCAILNAGTYIPDQISSFSSDIFDKQVALNLSGTAKCLEAIIPDMIARRSGQIVIVASVAGYRGLPKSISYGATKAALINMAEALAIETKDKGIKVQLVCPGFIKTPLTDKNSFPMPFLMEVDAAAARLVNGIGSDVFEIVFPRRFVYMLKFLQLFPHRFYIWLIAKSAKNV